MFAVLCITVLFALFAPSHQQGNVAILPIFRSSDVDALTAGIRISEAAPIGYVIFNITAYDPLGGQITYSLQEGASEVFEINEHTGEILLKSKLDFETRTTYAIGVVATSSSGSKLTGGYIFVEDANDRRPKFERTSYNFDLKEDSPVGFTISELYVEDREAKNQLIRVTCNIIVTPRACEVFRIQDLALSNFDWRGALVLNEPLDYEKEKTYSIGLFAFDGVNNITTEVQIGVLDINDSPPIFVRARGNDILEGLPVGTYIDYVSAKDTDTEGARPIRYELYGEPKALEFFNIEPVSGNITNTQVLDYENITQREFELEIRARELLSFNPNVLGNDEFTTTTDIIIIRVLDVNDNCPTFNKQQYSAFIPEDIAQGSNIALQMTVIDEDSMGSYSSFRLEVTGSNGIFGVDPTSTPKQTSMTITVQDATALDYDTPPRSYDLTVRAIPNGPGVDPSSCTGEVQVHIELQDINDIDPRFPADKYRTEVAEDAVGGTVLITITATDGDSGIFGQDGLRYSLIGSGDNLFNIDAISGVVTVKNCGSPGIDPCIDYEVKDNYEMTVIVEDNKGDLGARQSMAQLIIDITNVNDNAPRFELTYFRSINEGESRTTDDLIIHAIDDDNDVITYTIPPNQPEAALWQVDSTTGEITAIRSIQYSDVPDPLRGTFRFEAQASDGKYNTLASIEIRVIDVNDNVPVFLPNNYIVSIPEGRQPSVYVIQVTCSDGDAPTTVNGVVDVTVDEGGFGKFVTFYNGTIANNQILTNIYTSPDAIFDHDVQDQFILIVKARDRGSPANTGTATVTVNILDINNRSPYFTPPTASETVFENRPVGWLVSTVSAEDPDNQQPLEISFVEPTRAFGPSGVEVTDSALFKDLFSIDSSGSVRVNRPLDRDIISFMTFTLYVQDVTANPIQEGYGALFIRILEYNDQAPYFELPFYTLDILEERPVGSFAGFLLARDEDDQIEFYQLISNPGDRFTIATRSGILRVNGRLDYETQHNVTLVVQAFDDGSPSLGNTTVVFINIININDNTPTFTQPLYQIDMDEHYSGTNVLQVVSATDGDEGDYGVVKYATDDAYFRVDEDTGQIFLKPGSNLDREVQTSYSFRVTAYDSPLDPSVRLQTTVPVYVILRDINDNCPVFSQTVGFSGVVIETADVGDQVLELFATDRDDGINRRIKFSIDPLSAFPPMAFNLFDIQSIQSVSASVESGRIEVKNSLRNQAGVYNFTVTASDRNGDNSTGTMCSTRVLVTVRVQEAINDAPIWVLPPTSNFSIDVLESQYDGMLVYDCKAVDPNSGDAGIIDYSFNVQQSLTDKTAEFHINSVTCIIRAQIVYDREQVDSYVLTVVAKDRGDPSASSETVLIVNVLDVNDNEPEFPMRNGETIPYDFTIREGEVRPVIGAVSATDKDTDHKNNKIYYRIVAGNDDGYFTLDRETGEIKFTAKGAQFGLDREVKAVYAMDILAFNEVSDDTVIRNRRKRSTNPSIVTVFIRVEDVNDTPPQFTDSDYYGCVPLNARYGQSILQVEAVDQDVVRAPVMEYSKVSETTGNYFSVDRSLGTIRNTRLLSDIRSRQPVVRVRVDDDANNQLRVDTSGSVAEADVQIFVTDETNEVILEVSQPSADVRYYQDQLIRVMQNSSTPGNPILYVCIREIRDHIKDDGSRSFTSSDVFLSAVGPAGGDSGGYVIYSRDRLRSILLGQFSDEKSSYNYRTLHVKTVDIESDEDELSLKEDAVLAIFIIALLLIFLGLILFCLACCLIRNSKKKKMKKLRAEEHTHVEVVRHEPPPEVLTSVNPVYDNKGFQGEETYAVVQKTRPAPQPVSPPIIPVTVPAMDTEEQQREVYITEPILEVPSETPEPVIITEPMPLAVDDEEPEPVIITELESEPVIVTELEPEPVIITQVEPLVITDPVMQDEPPRPMQPPPPNFFDPETDPVIIETEVISDSEFPASQR